jgi:RNA polymerase sigma-70 factor, ECF subfamily
MNRPVYPVLTLDFPFPGGAARFGVEETPTPARSGSVDTQNEWDLIRRCRSGSAGAFEPLVRAHEGPALAVAYGFLGDADEAADAVQDAFVKAYASLGRLREGSAFGPWFRSILRNLCLDRIRAPRSRRRAGIDELDGLSWTDALGSAAIERGEVEQAVRDALAALSEDHRAVLVLKEIEGLGYDEIARSLEIPAGTVASRLFHARAALRKVLLARGVTLEDVRR